MTSPGGVTPIRPGGAGLVGASPEEDFPVLSGLAGRLPFFVMEAVQALNDGDVRRASSFLADAIYAARVNLEPVKDGHELARMIADVVAAGRDFER